MDQPRTYPARIWETGSINYTKFTKIDHIKVEIIHISVIITAVTQVHGNRQKSRYKAKITVITVIVNS